MRNKSMDYNNLFRVLENVEIKTGGSAGQIRENILAVNRERFSTISWEQSASDITALWDSMAGPS